MKYIRNRVHESTMRCAVVAATVGKFSLPRSRSGFTLSDER